MAVHSGSELSIGGLNPCYVGAGSEGANLKAAVPVEAEQIFKCTQIDIAVRASGYRNHIANALLPRQ
ncbi:hypothetical protein D3C71_1394670 [compost metagenome]